MPIKSLTQQGAHSPLRTLLLGHIVWNISTLSSLCIRFHKGQIIHMRLGYTGTCRKAVRQRHSIFFFLPERLCHRHCIVFDCILARQCRVDTRTLARWTPSVFRAYGVPTQVLFQQRFLDRMAYALHKLFEIQPTVTVQCLTAFWPGNVV